MLRTHPLLQAVLHLGNPAAASSQCALQAKGHSLPWAEPMHLKISTESPEFKPVPWLPWQHQCQEWHDSGGKADVCTPSPLTSKQMFSPSLSQSSHSTM